MAEASRFSRRDFLRAGLMGGAGGNPGLAGLERHGLRSRRWPGRVHGRVQPLDLR